MCRNKSPIKQLDNDSFSIYKPLNTPFSLNLLRSLVEPLAIFFFSHTFNWSSKVSSGPIAVVVYSKRLPQLIYQG
jgi:hypothetical protein